ncbi:MAG: DNA polymerase III subunit gamma/tau [Prevotella sp.]|nr:DNA polymerase III subunit gamma/tau [Prevotella sp.]
MSSYIVSARKYRPMTFDSVVGQAALTTTLKNAVQSGKLAHAYLFCGPRGVGKTTCARIFAKVINCLNPTPTGDACGQCESCRAFDEGRSLNIFELDAASNNGVEHIKALMEQTRIPPQTGRYKVFIIDEVHMLSTAAFNSFLKTLEEPPSYVIFILATTEKHRILPTIISRCQVYDFERMTVQGIISHLKHVAESEGITYEDLAFNVIAEKADGGMRDALSIFDQVASFCQGNITYQKVIEDLNVLDADNYFSIVDDCLDNKVAEVMVTLNKILARGFDGGQTVNGLASHIRNVLMALDPQTTKLIEAAETQRQRYAEQAKRCQPKFLYKALKLLNQCDVNYRMSSNKRLLVELTLIQLAQITQEDDGDAAGGRRPCKRLKSLFRKLMGEMVAVNAASSTFPKGERQSQKYTVNGDEDRGMMAEPLQGTYDAARVPTPATRDNAANATRPHIKIGSIGASFSKIMGTNTIDRKVEEKIPLGETANEAAEFTEDDVRREWLMMCNRMMQTKQSALAKRMMNVQLKITEFPHIDCIVENTMLQGDIAEIFNRVQVTMAKCLHNGGVKMTLRLAEQKEVVRRLSPHEFMQKLIDTNPAFAAIQKELQLEVE